MSIAKLLREFDSPNRDEFNTIYDHVFNYHSCSNMHIRDTRILKGKRGLRFNHMINALNGAIVGDISGPENLELVYEIRFNKMTGKCQYIIDHYSGSEKDLIRISRSLKKWLLKRVETEKIERDEMFSNYQKGEFYLRRSVTGMDFNHYNIQAGLAQNAFSKRFAERVKTKGFEVIHPS